MSFAEHDDMIDAFPPDRTDQSFSVSVLPWRARRRRSIANAHRLKSSDEDLTIGSIPIADQIAGSLFPTASFRDLICDPFRSWMCCGAKPQVCPISMPILSNSPCRRGAPHSGLAMLISPISLRISCGTVGRPPRCLDFQRQYALKPARCQRMMVSGLTIASASHALGNTR